MSVSALQDLPYIELRRTGDGPEILSVYLELDPTRSIEHGHRAELLNALRQLRETLPDDLTARFDEERKRVEDYLLTRFEPQGRSLAIFSSIPRDLWFAQPLRLAIETTVRYQSRPYLLPLEKQVSLERTCIALVDREQARILTTRLGTVEMDKHSRDFLPRKVRETGAKFQSQGRGQAMRSMDAPDRAEESLEDWVLEHFQKTIDEIEEVQRDHAFSRLVLGGTEGNLARFSELLPDDLRRKFKGTFHGEIFQSSEAIQQDAMGVVHEARQHEDAELVQRAIDMTLAGGQGAIGWDDIMMALIEGRVHQLFVVEGAQPSGARCPNGHFIAVESMTCPACGAQPERVADLAALAARLCEETGAEFRVVSGPAGRLLEGRDVAAILRF